MPAVRPYAQAIFWPRLTCFDVVASAGISELDKGTIVWAFGTNLL